MSDVAFNRNQLNITGFSYTGSSDPSSSLGNNGDYYLKWNGSAITIFGPKTAGAWGSGSTIGGVSFVGLPAHTPPIPNTSLLIIQIPSEDLIVSGAGISGVNSTFTKGSNINSRPSYSNGTYHIKWNTSGFSGWIIQLDSGTVNKYVSYDDVATPDLVTTWVHLSSVVVASNSWGYNGTYTPTGVKINSRLKFIKDSSTYFNWTGTTWVLHDNSESDIYSSSSDVTRPDLATGWTQIWDFSFGATTISSGTSLAPVPTVVIGNPTVKTLQWSDITGVVVPQFIFLTSDKHENAGTLVNIFSTALNVVNGTSYLLEAFFVVSQDSFPTSTVDISVQGSNSTATMGFQNMFVETFTSSPAVQDYGYPGTYNFNHVFNVTDAALTIRIQGTLTPNLTGTIAPSIQGLDGGGYVHAGAWVKLTKIS